VLRQNDQTAAAVDDLVPELDDAGEKVFTAGGAMGTLSWIGDGHPVANEQYLNRNCYNQGISSRTSTIWS
jgi:preprotein translocase subunit YajC